MKESTASEKNTTVGDNETKETASTPEEQVNLDVKSLSFEREYAGLDDIPLDEPEGIKEVKNGAEYPKERRPDPKRDIASLNALEMRLYAHRYSETMMSCYGPSIDPKNATEDRGEALSMLEREDQELLCRRSTGRLFNRLDADADSLDQVQKAQVRVLKRKRAQQLPVPIKDQAAFTRLLTKADAVWRAAKQANDWESFEPYLDQIVEAMRSIAQEIDSGNDPYDMWLDYFEEGTDRTFYDSFFSQVKETVVPLLDEIKQRPQLSRACVEGHFEANRQWHLARDLMVLEGLDPDVMVLTSTEHPFSDGLTTNYAIIAAHVYEDNVLSNLYTMLHEGGHCLYETGVDPKLNYTSLKGGVSMGMHEGQSRFFENHVGRAEAFAPTLLELLRKNFPGQFVRVSARQFYQAANRVEPGLLRTEADELTYPLHIIIRYEIEQLLMAGEIRAHDVPREWADRYKKYLGVTVKDYTHGALQDMHWANGMIGYFPTYALGGAYGAQLHNQMIKDGMDFDGVLATGDITPICEWLRKNIWQWGHIYSPQDLIENACGEGFSATYYTNYLTDKFTDLYDLK